MKPVLFFDGLLLELWLFAGAINDSAIFRHSVITRSGLEGLGHRLGFGRALAVERRRAASRTGLREKKRAVGVAACEAPSCFGVRKGRVGVCELFASAVSVIGTGISSSHSQELTFTVVDRPMASPGRCAAKDPFPDHPPSAVPCTQPLAIRLGYPASSGLRPTAPCIAQRSDRLFPYLCAFRGFLSPQRRGKSTECL